MMNTSNTTSQAKNLQLLEEYIYKLDKLIRDYKNDHLQIEMEEENSLTSLHAISVELKRKKKEGLDFTHEVRKSYFRRVLIINPPESFSVSKPVSGFLGMFGQSITSSHKSHLHIAIKLVLEDLEKLEKLEETAAPVSNPVTAQSQMVAELKDAIKSELMDEMRKESDKVFQKGEEVGRKKAIDEIRQYLEANDNKVGPGLLRLLGAASSFDPAQGLDDKERKEKERLDEEKTIIEKQKSDLKHQLPDAKFKVIEAMIKDKNSYTQFEIDVVKLISFQLMLHKNDKSVRDILADCCLLIQEKIGLCPRLVSNLEPLKDQKETISTTPEPLTEISLKAFHSLTGKEARYLITDGTANTVFRTLFLKGTTKELAPSDENYRDEGSYMDKFRKEKLGATSRVKDGRLFDNAAAAKGATPQVPKSANAESSLGKTF